MAGKLFLFSADFVQTEEHITHSNKCHKHGLMPLDHGGSIRVCSWETPSHYRVSIEDDGVGFDTAILDTDRKHIGLRNIRGRLETMVDGTLHIESTPGKGTKVLISIPKESCKR